MNENLSPDIQQSLMKHVERAVRPIPAGKKRKLQMREELLAHLTGIYQEELSQHPDETAALAAALARFGSPAETFAELARDVTWNQRFDHRLEQIAVVLNYWLGLRASDSILSYIGRAAASVAVMGLTLFVVLFGIFTLSGMTIDPVLLPLTIKLISHSVVSIFCFLLAAQSLYRAFYGPAQRRWLWVVMVCGCWTLVFTVLTQAMWLLMTEDIVGTLARTPRFALNSALFLLPSLYVTAWLARLAEKSNKPFEAWTKLELED